ncbi:hypothetical protein P3X46_022459 [Hevea brasiliensis]|uniref:Uncharacterized protein n=2 Tax=Hevea brasiliensis TaxID=3981 RepID=A0ABQ9LBF0_HEVBR|nr:cytochrome P450 89A2-like [Hevea brasiliensis]KAF2317338.1 hypothetical protein GH714_020369 [Hevea brasiliensis]KAJ9162703.1 hypothetical protein P3X46_022459 [Hevea brasiliensis]
MELFIFFASLCLCLLLKPLITQLHHLLSSSSKPTNKNPNLPPGPSRISLIATFVFRGKSFFELGPIISNLRQKYGPLITVHLGSQPTIYITNNSLAHQALVQNGAVFADRPISINNLIVSNSKKIISKSPYGPTWRALRRNLTAGVLNPSQLRSFSHVRERVLNNLIDAFKHDSKGEKAVFVEEYFRHAIFSMLVLLCFGDNVEEKQIREIEAAQQRLFKNFHRFKLFIILPKLGKFLFKKQWKKLTEIVTGYDEAIVPLIRSRKKISEQEQDTSRKDQGGVFYVDTLLNFQAPEEEENLKEVEIVGLCNEFISAGTDTTMTALQWIMANVVKYPAIQAKILEEIKGGIGDDQRKFIKEDDLQKMPYIKAVVLEGLRRHPPGYAPATPHAVTEDVELGGYKVPKGTAVNFLIADMGRDPNVWENPMEFKPERFLKSSDGDNDHRQQGFDVTGSREIKMMPFGAGRRICPGYGLAMLHMEYLVANLVWHFEWKPADGEDVDLTEKFDLTISMKNPLRVHLTPRF